MTNESPSYSAAWGGRAFKLTLLACLLLYLFMVLSLIGADIAYLVKQELEDEPAGGSIFLGMFASKEIMHALWLSIVSSLVTVAVSLCFAIPIGYALSRYRFPGLLVVDTIVDIPIVLPPLVIGISLLVLFRMPGFSLLADHFVYNRKGIVLAQFAVSSALGIRAIKAAFDTIDKRVEDVALTLGASRLQAFLKVALPLARNGIVAGGVLTWARAFAIFGPLMVFTGAVRMKTEVLPTSIYLELSIGQIELALAIALLMIILSVVTLVVFKRLGGQGYLW